METWVSEATSESRREGTQATGELICTAIDEPCQHNGDCCEFDTSLEPGASMCVDFGDQAKCASLCYEDEDCASGCCAALGDGDLYGACTGTDLCEAGRGLPSCWDGVAFFSACARALGVPCGRDATASLVSSCHEATPSRALLLCVARYVSLGYQACSPMLARCRPVAPS